jgi:lysozyme
LGRLLPYRCPAGKLSIGYGRNIQDIGLSRVEAEFLLDNDIDSIERSLTSHLPWFAALDDVRKGALINMGFMGIISLLGFKKMLSALERGDYATAAREALDSKWATDVGPRRSGDVARMLETGEA